MLVKVTKEMLKSSFQRVGVEIRKKVDAVLFDITPAGGTHPVEAVYAACGKPCLVKVPLDRIVTFNYSAFSLDTAGGHPFVKTLEQYQVRSEMAAKESLLCRYYELFQPRTASELMDLFCPHYAEFNNLPALAAPPLDSWKSPAEYFSHIKKVFQKEDEAQGVRLGKFIGGSQFGPIDSKKLEIEYLRLIRLYESIKKHGFCSSQCDWITGTVWADDNDWVVSVTTGQHRIACLAALGYDSAIIYLQPKKAPAGVLLRSCYRHFPTVVNGFHTEEEALIIFDRILRKKPPKAASEWLAYCTHGGLRKSGPILTDPHEIDKKIRMI